jgi:hypothetical protein
MDTSLVTNATNPMPPEAAEPAATTSVAVTSGLGERWEVVVYDHPMYDTNLVATALEKLLNCSHRQATEYSRQMRSAGRVRVWEGKWTKAEVLRQTLEAEAIISKVQVIEPDKSPTDVPRK